MLSNRISNKSSSNPIIYEGATQSDLAAMFRMSMSDVKARIAGLRAVAWRSGYEVYSFKDAAQRLCKPPADIIERVLRMHPNDLPKMLAKEWWMAENQRLTYMERKKDLWPTKEVIELAGDAFKTMRLSLMLITDAVEREAGLDDKQREVITRLVYSALEDMREKLVDGFNYRRDNKVGEPVAQSEDEPASDI